MIKLVNKFKRMPFWLDHDAGSDRKTGTWKMRAKAQRSLTLVSELLVL